MGVDVICAPNAVDVIIGPAGVDLIVMATPTTDVVVGGAGPFGPQGLPGQQGAAGDVVVPPVIDGGFF